MTCMVYLLPFALTDIISIDMDNISIAIYIAISNDRFYSHQFLLTCIV